MPNFQQSTLNGSDAVTILPMAYSFSGLQPEGPFNGIASLVLFNRRMFSVS